MSLVVVMGSGETAPTMVKTHRQVFETTYAAVDGAPGPAVMLDTTFGFQDNADELVTRTRRYFAESVGRDVEPVEWRRADAPPLAAERSLALLSRARWAFAGPGSPTYALRQWSGTPVPAALLDVVRRGGTLVVGSAAACTVGSHAIPVYEIYKAGADLGWAAGLDVLGSLAGIRAALVPHYDNAEGGTYDTRFCYLGERRLVAMEELLPHDVGVLGVDEHTALLLDLGAGAGSGTATVTGNGTVTVRRRGQSRQLAAGTVLPLAQLGAWLSGREPLPDADGASESAGVATGVVLAGATATGGPAAPGSAGEAVAGATSVAGATATADEAPAVTSLRAAADAHRDSFDAAVAARDADACAAAVLALEADIEAWRSDTLQSDDVDHARRLLRAMIVQLGELAVAGTADPREAVAPFVEALLDVRRLAREARDYGTADRVRDHLTAAGVEVRDTREGVEWDLGGER